LKRISKKGLIPGARQGIGDPDTKAGFKDSVFVVPPRSRSSATILGEAGGGAAAVVSSRRPVEDVNYPLGDAGYFHVDPADPDAGKRRIPPVRDATSEEPHGPYSYVPPASPRTRKGMQRIVQGLNPGRRVKAREATDLVESNLQRDFPAAFAEAFDPFRRSPSPSPPGSPAARARGVPPMPMTPMDQAAAPSSPAGPPPDRDARKAPEPLAKEDEKGPP
jgi:hypothetical protein